MRSATFKNERAREMRAFSLAELLVVLVIMGILVLIALPNLMPLISRAKSTEAQQQLVFLHSLEQTYFYTYSRYTDDLEEIGFEQQKLVTDGGNANYLIEVYTGYATLCRMASGTATAYGFVFGTENLLLRQHCV